MENFEKEELQHLANIEGELVEIKQRTPNAKRAFLNGILQGGGAVIGGIAAVALLGWLLSVFGLLPGLNHIAPYLQNVIAQVKR